MSSKIIASENFEKELKKLAKKYASLRQEIIELIQNLKENPVQGTPIGKDCFKIRLAIKSKGRGKSGGARVITCVFTLQEKLVLLSIYDKSEKENIENRELEELIKAAHSN
jgi:mRNA-degrading endonuclease RelE of RelBE toxin-antitoxin system